MSSDRTEIYPPPAPSAPSGVAGCPSAPEGVTLAGPPADASHPPAGTEAPADGPWPEVAGYEILNEIGRGGMGVVYRARQKGLNRLVALKMILSGGHAGAVELARFRAEAEAIARLQHANIVHIHEVGESEGRPYFSLEYVDGGSLTDRLDGTPWPPADAARLVETLADAMHTAHQAGVVHRDLKPANILLTKGGKPAEGIKRNPDGSPSSPLSFSSVKITDFGLAKQMDSAHGQTQSGAILGTPSYMAPEQAGGRGREIGPATDVYALGAILYELLTGRPPFKAATPLDTVLQVVGEDPVPPRRLVPKLPRDLDTICLKCLEKNPAKRYGSAAELADDLGRWRQLQPIRARRIGRIGRGVRWCRRNPVLAAVCAVAAAVIVSLSVVFYVRLVAENKRTHAALRQSEVDWEKSQDTLARSLYEQARAVRLSNQPGRRWQALDLLAEAEFLRVRPRLVELSSEDGESRLPSKAELRREAAAALLLEDARVSHRVSLAAAPVKVEPDRSRFRAEICPDGRRALAWWVQPWEHPPKFGVRLFDLHDGRILGETGLPLFANDTLTLSPDAHWLAFQAADGSVRLRAFPSGEIRPPLPLPPLPKDLESLQESTRSILEFSPDGRFLVGLRSEAGRADLFLWDLTDPAASRHLARVEAAVACVAFRSDSRILAYRLGDKRIALTDLTRSDATEVVELPLTVAGGDPFRAGRPITLAWSPSEPLLAIGAVSATGKGTVLFWDTAAEAERARWEGDFDSDGIMLAFAADGRRLALGTGDGTIRCFQVAERRVILRLEGAQHDGIECLHWEGSDRLLSAGILNAFKAWEFSDSSLRSSLGALPDRITSFAFSPDGGRLAVRTPGPRPRAIVLERFAGKVLHTFDLPDSSGVLVFRGDGNVLGWASPTGVAVAWDLSEGREMARSKGTTQVDLSLFEPTFLEDGRLVTPAMEEKGLVILDLLSGEKKETKVALSPRQLAESGIRRFALSGDGRLLIGLPREIDPVRQAIPLWEVSSGERLGELAPAEDDASGFVHATPSPDGRLLFKYCQPASFDASVESSELSLSVWDLRDKHRLWQAKCSTLVSAWAFSADGKLLAVGYQNGFVEVWDARAGEELFRWQPHGEREVRHLAFTPDGTDVACGDGGSPVRILHLAELKRQLAAMGLDW